MEENKAEIVTEELIDRIGQECMAEDYKFLQRIANGETITNEEIEKHNQKVKVHKSLVATFVRLQRAGRIKTNPENEKFDQQLSEKIRSMPSTVKDIVTDLPPTNTSNT